MDGQNRASETMTSCNDASAGGDRTTARMDDLSRLLAGWLWETDRDQRLTHVGCRILDVLQYHPSEFVGRPVAELFGSDIPLAIGSHGGHARPFGDHETTIKARDGAERVLALAAVPVFADQSGRFNGYRGVARDVTESKAQERALQQAKAEAERANRAKSDFLATMSHEFRTPLNAVIGFADVMHGEHFGPLGHAKYRDYTADIVASARHLAQMIDDVLDMAKIEAGRLELHEERARPGELMDRAVRMVKPRAEEAGQVLGVSYPGERVEVRVDGPKFVQILINLLVNAVKFTAAGGRIELSAELTQSRALAFTVIDTGIGMSAEDQATALEPFGQANAASSAGRQGSGLGLPIVKALAELHGGTLAIDSAPGAGTTITVTVPADRVESIV
jgi:signal transduction histidine kinase